MFGKKDIENLSVGDYVYLEDAIDEMIVVSLLPCLRDRVSVCYTANRLAPIMVANVFDIVKINGKDVSK